MFRSNKKHQVIEGVFRGSGRKFSDAARLQLIDEHMLPLVHGMNSLVGVETIACCEGHGLLGIYSTPYVAFTAPPDVACKFQIALERASNSNSAVLNYWWDMDARYREDGILIYRINAPSLDRHFWVTRKKLNKDFETILNLFQESHLQRK